MIDFRKAPIFATAGQSDRAPQRSSSASPKAAGMPHAGAACPLLFERAALTLKAARRTDREQWHTVGLVARWALLLIAAASLACWQTACDRPADDEPPAPTAAADDRPAPLTKYSFPEEVAAQGPEDLARFVRQAIQTMLIGEYNDYRALMSRSRTPESEDRFRVIQESLRTVAVISIEEVTLPDIPPPAYRVLTGFAFDPESQAALRLESRELAILVFKESGQWRLLIAPPALQPHDEPVTSRPTTTPTTPAVEYPWDDPNDDY